MNILLLLGSAIMSIWVYSTTSVSYFEEVASERLMISLERPRVIMENPRIMHVVNVTSRRPGRSDPNHYVHMCLTFVWPFNNSFIININVKDNQVQLYSVTYLELRYKFCEFLKMLKFDLYYKKNITEPLAPSEIKFENNNNCFLDPVISLSLERPRVVDVNPDLARVINVISRRPGRFDKTHYIKLWVEYYKPMDSSGEITLTVHEFLSNEYRPSFVVLTLKFCDYLNDFIKNNHCYYTTNLSVPLVHFRLNKDCYFKPGIYYYPNWTLPLVSLPTNFPFVKGRVFANHTYKGKLVMAGSIDLELKTLPARKYKGRP